MTSSTRTSNYEKLDQQATKLLGFEVNFAPLLSQTPESALSQSYAFTNGVLGKGPFGFQIPVLSAKPGDANYSALLRVNSVTWKDGSTIKELKSMIKKFSARELTTDFLIYWDGQWW